MALALACDLRFATPDARMAVAANQVGLSGCDVGLSYLLPKLVGAAVAAQLLLTSQFLLAPRARELGLFAEIVDAAAIEAAGTAAVDDMLCIAPLALALTKQGLNNNLSAPSLEAAIELEDRQQAMLANDPEFHKRMREFSAKSRAG
jgi:enoyl-CoA hydratase/carnithine racemase